MITVNLDELLNQIKSADTKDYLSTHNFAVLDNLNSVEQENNDKKTYNENIKKITSFVNSNSGKDKTDNKKLYSQFNVVLQSPYFNYNDIGKKAIKVLVQNKFFDLIGILLEKHLNSIDDESLASLLYEILHLEEEPVKENEIQFKQIKEKLVQDNLKFRVFSENCADILNLPEENPNTFLTFFHLYIVGLICQRPMDKISFMKALLKFKAKKIQLLLEILYILAVHLSSEYERLSVPIQEKIVFEYISYTINASYERIRNEKSIQKLFELLSKTLKKKSDEAEALSLLNNLNTLASTQYLKMENIDLRKNLNIEEFRF